MIKINENIINQVEKFVRSKLPEWFIDAHVKIVVKESIMLQKFYPETDLEVIIISAWLHDVGHKYFGDEYVSKLDNHHIYGQQIAEKYLKSINYNNFKLDKVLHCIISHSTSKFPNPKTNEAMIVLSADNLAHFSNPNKLIELVGYKKFFKKLDRDLQCEFLLPQAKNRAIKLLKLIMRGKNE